MQDEYSKFGLQVTCKDGSKPEPTGATAQTWQYLLSPLNRIGTIQWGLGRPVSWLVR